MNRLRAKFEIEGIEIHLVERDAGQCPAHGEVAVFFATGAQCDTLLAIIDSVAKGKIQVEAVPIGTQDPGEPS